MISGYYFFYKNPTINLSINIITFIPEIRKNNYEKNISHPFSFIVKL